MGSSQSITNKSTQAIRNDIVQKASQHCVYTCNKTGGSQSVEIIDSDILGDIKLENTCFLSGNSCTLKSSLDSTLLNSLSSVQEGAISAGDNPFDVAAIIGKLTGDRKEIINENSQFITNDISQNMDSLCGYNVNDIDNVQRVYYKNATHTGDTTIANINENSKNNCISNNMAKMYTENSASNTQKAKIEGNKCLQSLAAVIGLLLGGIVVIFLLKAYIEHTKQSNEDKNEKK